MPRRNHRRKGRNHGDDRLRRLEQRVRDLESIVFADDGEQVATGVVVVLGNRNSEKKVVLESDQAVEWE